MAKVKICQGSIWERWEALQVRMFFRYKMDQNATRPLQKPPAPTSRFVLKDRDGATQDHVGTVLAQRKGRATTRPGPPSAARLPVSPRFLRNHHPQHRNLRGKSQLQQDQGDAKNCQDSAMPKSCARTGDLQRNSCQNNWHQLTPGCCRAVRDQLIFCPSNPPESL